MATLNLFLETPPTPGGELPPLRPKVDIMLFFKQYIPDKEHPVLKYAGRRVVPKDSKVKVSLPACVAHVCVAEVCLAFAGRQAGWQAGRPRFGWGRSVPRTRCFVGAGLRLGVFERHA